jgi:hypothetical protein
VASDSATFDHVVDVYLRGFGKPVPFVLGAHGVREWKARVDGAVVRRFDHEACIAIALPIIVSSGLPENMDGMADIRHVAMSSDVRYRRE